MGIPVSVSMEDVHGSASALRATADLATNLTDEVLPGRPGTLALNVHEPVGVVAAITPWNFPLYIALSKIGAALAAGNSVVLKPSEIASLSSLRLADLAVSAGIPEGVLNVVPGLGPAAGAALAGHHDVDMLTFTGSTVTGKVLMALAGGSNLKRLALECGGKSAHIVLPDVSDLDGIAAEIARGILFNSGQVCTAGSRLIVHRSVREPLMSRVLAHAAAVVAGDPLDSRVDFGPLASAGQYARVRAYLELGCAEDARMVFGKAQLAHPPAGCMLMPVIFSDVSKSMRIAREEIFGPVLCVLDFDTIEQAVEIANATPYGLVGTVWTGDLAAGLGIARRLRCGHVAVAGAPGEPAEVSGGSFEPHGQSGFGAEGGARGLRTMMKLKSLAVDLGAGAVSGRP
jgi:acyl-CoA reductase-like NAD-dependent aldehyde dehydrogenase